MDAAEQRERYVNVIDVDNETHSQMTRTTVQNKKLTYRLNVLQQPVRARACGQGAKSSADRRPVDPPPIVELKIFEGEHAETDVTFKLSATYCLFVELEQARQIAKARNQPEKCFAPVLTGQPAAGMVCLDRPSPAGYFIFPDLSVRHEGKYRLSFTLFEQLKDPKDADKPDETKERSSDEDADDLCFTHRLTVRSEPFTVYSAKKFPGLTMSTTLSRLVAEQGCRVRIRRDVRMRRRDQKSEGGPQWDQYEDGTAEARARLSATPEPRMHAPHGYLEPIPRPSSASKYSQQAAVSRRTSLQDIQQTYQQPHYQAGPPQMQTGYAHAMPYGAPQHQQQSFTAQQPSMPPPPHQYQTSNCQPSAPSQQTSYAYQPAPVSQNPYEHSNPQQRAGVSYAPQPQLEQHHIVSQNSAPPAPVLHHAYPQHPSQRTSIAPSQTSYQYATPSMDSSRQSSQTATASVRSGGSVGSNSMLPSFHLPPLNTTNIPSDKLEPASPVSAGPHGSRYSNSQAQIPQDTHKRSFANVFPNQHQSWPLRDGARPRTSFPSAISGAGDQGLSVEDDEDAAGSTEVDIRSLSMHYRRADGRQIHRALPAHR